MRVLKKSVLYFKKNMNALLKIILYGRFMRAWKYLQMSLK